MKRNMVIIVLALALAVASYMLGWSNVSLRDHEAREAQGRLALSLRIYQEMERGDFQRAKGDMGIVVLGQTRYYEYEFGVPTGTNFFVQKFATAQAIASQIESTLVPISSITNQLPANMKLQIEGEKQ
jgi:hypothetical protein